MSLFSRKRARFGAAPFLLLCLFALPAFTQNTASLPQAPLPEQRAPSAPVHAPGATRYRPSEWDLGVDPGEKVPPLYPRDKMAYWMHEEIDPIDWIPGVFSAGWEQLVDSDPKYGSDSPAFGERLGAMVIRDTSMRFFSSSLLPTLTREDPRYYRMGEGGIRARGVYAAERVFVSQRDDGNHGFNFSDTLGHLAASALTPTYYPATSANGKVVMSTWALSLAGDAGGKVFLEFWPDLRRLVRHQKRDI